MGLLIDGQLNNTQDLRNYENAILDVASLENIDLAGKMILAQDEISTRLFSFLLRLSSIASSIAAMGSSSRRSITSRWELRRR